MSFIFTSEWATQDPDNRIVACRGPFPKGFVRQGHKHVFDHHMRVPINSTLKVTFYQQLGQTPLREEIITGPISILAEKNIYHQIEVLSDEGYWDCEFEFAPNTPEINKYIGEIIE